MTTTIELKTADLTGAALDWAVAKVVECRSIAVNHLGGVDITQDESIRLGVYGALWCGAYGHRSVRFQPSTDWAQGRPLIEKHLIEIGAPMSATKDGIWCANWEWGDPNGYLGQTPLIAAMRALVAAKLGDVVLVPGELASRGDV